MSLIRVTWPSTAPELHCRVRPLTTASQSFWRNAAKPWTGGGPWSRAAPWHRRWPQASVSEQALAVVAGAATASAPDLARQAARHFAAAPEIGESAFGLLERACNPAPGRKRSTTATVRRRPRPWSPPQWRQRPPLRTRRVDGSGPAHHPQASRCPEFPDLPLAVAAPRTLRHAVAPRRGARRPVACIRPGRTAAPNRCESRGTRPHPCGADRWQDHRRQPAQTRLGGSHHLDLGTTTHSSRHRTRIRLAANVTRSSAPLCRPSRWTWLTPRPSLYSSPPGRHSHPGAHRA